MIYLNFFSHLNLAFLQKNKRKQKNEIKNETNTDIIWKVRKYHLSLVSTGTGGLTIMLGLFSRIKCKEKNGHYTAHRAVVRSVSS